MAEEIPLFKINPGLDRAALAATFARDRRVQIRNFLTADAAATIHQVLSTATPWGLAWNDGNSQSDISPPSLASYRRNNAPRWASRSLSAFARAAMAFPTSATR